MSSYIWDLSIKIPLNDSPCLPAHQLLFLVYYHPHKRQFSDENCEFSFIGQLKCSCQSSWNLCPEIVLAQSAGAAHAIFKLFSDWSQCKESSATVEAWTEQPGGWKDPGSHQFW